MSVCAEAAISRDWGFLCLCVHVCLCVMHAFQDVNTESRSIPALKVTQYSGKLQTIGDKGTLREAHKLTSVKQRS